MKFKQLQKRLIRILAIGIAIIIICAGVAYFSMSQSAAKTEEIEAMKAASIAADVKARAMQDEYDQAQRAQKFYSDNSVSENTDPQSFRREFARELLSRIKEQMKLPDLKFSMEQFKIADPQYQLNTVALFTSKVNIEFRANSDLDAYNLLKNVVSSFPGQVKIIRYEIKKAGIVDDKLLEGVANGSISGIVSGSIEFEWQSIKDKPVADNAAGAAANQAPGMPAQPGIPGTGIRPGMPPQIPGGVR